MKQKIKAFSSVQRVFTVVRTLFPVAARKFPLFFPLEALKTLCGVLMPFLGVFITPVIINMLQERRSFEEMIPPALVLILGEMLLNAVRQLAVWKLNKYQERIGNYFTELTGAYAMELDFQLTEDKQALDQLEKANTGMSWYSGGVYGISEQLFMLAGNLMKIGGFTAVIAVHAPLLLAVICLYVMANGYLTVKSNKVELTAYKKLSAVNRLFSYFGWSIVDFRYGKDVRLYDGADMLVEKWDKNQKISRDTWMWQADGTLKYDAIATVLSVVRMAFTYGYSAILAISGAFGLGTFTQMIESAGGLDSTMGGFVGNVTELIKRCNYAWEFVLFTRYPKALARGERPVKKGLHSIEFQNVVFSYPGSDTRVLDGVSFTVQPGEKISMVGLNGAGKTTLVKLLCRLYDPTAGRILLDGHDIREYDLEQYMLLFAPVFQDFKLFGFTVAENICLKDEKEITPQERRLAEALMERAGLKEMTEKLSKGMDTRIFKVFDEGGVEPSGGEQQKLAIARALYKDAPVVILDEPTAALDPIAEYEIYRQFDALVENRTAFYISHRLSSCRFCDHIAVFSGGRVAEWGTHAELVNRPGGIYAAMFEAQAQYYR